MVWGVRILIQFNRGLLGKWLKRYTTKNEALSRLVVETKYDSLQGGWCSKEVVRLFEVGVWKYIRSGWRVFFSFIRYGMKDGSKDQVLT